MRSFFALLRLSALQLRYYKTRYLIMELLLVLGSGFLFISLAYLHSIEKSLEQGLITRFQAPPSGVSPPSQGIFLLSGPDRAESLDSGSSASGKGLQSLPG